MTYKLFKIYEETEPVRRLTSVPVKRLISEHHDKEELKDKLFGYMCNGCVEEIMDKIISGTDELEAILTTFCGLDYIVEEECDNTN